MQVWHARIPNSEVLAQALLFAGLLALARAHQDDDAFFAPVAGVLFGLLPFARFDGVLAVGLAAAGVALHWSVGGRVRGRFCRDLTVALALFAAYLFTWLAPYAEKPRIWVAVNWLPLASGGRRASRCSWPVVGSAGTRTWPPPSGDGCHTCSWRSW